MKGAIFDIDGTLLDSMGIWDDLGARYLETQYIKAEDKLSKILFPMTLEESALYMKQKYKLSKTTSEIIQGINKIIEKYYRYEVNLKSGAENYVKSLYKSGLPMILATTGDKELAAAALKRLGIIDCFRDILSTSDYGTSKHEPDIYLKAAEILQVKPCECMVYEDVLYALSTAKAAGFICTGVKDAASADDWENICAISDYQIEAFTQF
jgi:HAD superfamily hydrolase (TIGR01509 family)